MRKLANNSQRFFAYFIDMTIISFVVSMLTSPVFAVMKFDVTMKDQIIKKVMEEINVVFETGYIDNFLYYNIDENTNDQSFSFNRFRKRNLHPQPRCPSGSART